MNTTLNQKLTALPPFTIKPTIDRPSPFAKKWGSYFKNPVKSYILLLKKNKTFYSTT